MDSDVPLSAYIIQHLEGNEEQFVLTVPPAVVGRSDGNVVEEAEA